MKPANRTYWDEPGDDNHTNVMGPDGFVMEFSNPSTAMTVALTLENAYRRGLKEGAHLRD